MTVSNVNNVIYDILGVVNSLDAAAEDEGFSRHEGQDWEGEKEEEEDHEKEWAGSPSYLYPSENNPSDAFMRAILKV